MLEDLFKVVKKRFNDDDNKTETEKPKFKCPRCQHMITVEHYNELLKVCPDCNYHGRMTARERIAITVDKESFVEFDKDMKSCNPINYPEYEEIACCNIYCIRRCKNAGRYSIPYADG